MIIFLIVIVAPFLYAVLVRHFGRNAHRRAATAPTSPRTDAVRLPDLPGDDVIDPGPGRSTWTALDDHQLNRLLRESS